MGVLDRNRPRGAPPPPPAPGPQFRLRSLLVLTLLISVALALGKRLGLSPREMSVGAVLMLPSLVILAVALFALGRDVAAMSRRQRVVHGLLLAAVILAVWMILWLSGIFLGD